MRKSWGIAIGVLSVCAWGPALMADPPGQPAEPSKAAQPDPLAPKPDGKPDDKKVAPPFEVTTPEGWKVIRQTEKSITLARADAPLPLPADQPMVVITKSSKVFQEETIKRQSVIQFGDDLKMWTFRGQPKVEKISVNGQPGYECLREGARTKDDAAQRVYVGKLFLANGNIVVMGYGPDDDKAEALVETFKAVMRSVKAKP